MPQLHANQIQFQAPDPAHINLAKEQNYLSGEFDRLGKQFDALGDTINKINDVELASTMKQAYSKGLNDLQNYEPEDNNYEPKKQEVLSNIQRLYMNAPEEARVRFARNNPMFMEELNLSADKLILKKQQDFETIRIQHLLPQMASNVTEGKSTYETERENLRNMTANLPNTIAEQLLYNFDDAIIKDKIDDLISAHRFQDALDMLDDVKTTYTLDPAYRNMKRNVIQNTITKIREEQQQELERLQRENAKVEKVNADIAAGGTGAGGGSSSSSSSGTSTNAINKADQDVLSTLLMEAAREMPDQYDDIVDAITKPRSERTMLPNGQYIEGPYVYSADGKQIVSLSNVSAEAIGKAVREAKPIADVFPQRAAEIENTSSQIYLNESMFLQQQKDDKDLSHHSLIELDDSLKTSASYQNITDDEHKRLSDYRRNWLKSLGTVEGISAERDHKVAYNRLGTGAIAAGAATGATALGKLGGVVGGPVGAGIGAAAGAVGGAALGYFGVSQEAESGVQAAHILWDEYEETSPGPESNPFLSNQIVTKVGEPQQTFEYQEVPQFDPTKTSLYKGNHAQRSLSDPQRALRTAIATRKQAYKEEFDYDVTEGSIAEFVLGQFTMLRTSEPQKLLSVGLNPGIAYGLSINDVGDRMMDYVRQNGWDQTIITQVADDNAQKEVNGLVDKLFDSMFYQLQGNTDVELTDEQKKKREDLRKFLRVGTRVDGNPILVGVKTGLNVDSGGYKNYALGAFKNQVKQGQKKNGI